jgi:hypothetical protein
MTRTKSVPFSIAWAVIAVLVGLNTHAVVGNIVLLSAAEQNVQTSGGGEVEGILVEDGTLKEQMVQSLSQSHSNMRAILTVRGAFISKTFLQELTDWLVLFCSLLERLIARETCTWS